MALKVIEAQTVHDIEAERYRLYLGSVEDCVKEHEARTGQTPKVVYHFHSCVCVPLELGTKHHKAESGVS